MTTGIKNDAEQRMAKSVEKFRADLVRVRTGKASPSILENVSVEYYGSRVPLSQVASVSAPQPRLLVVQAWDKGAVQAIVKAVQAADLGLNPAEDGELIRVPIPPLTEERRRDIVRLCGKLTEEARIAIRNLRREANERVKKLEKDKEITEDDAKTGTKKVQELTDEHIAKLDELLKQKETEVLER